MNGSVHSNGLSRAFLRNEVEDVWSNKDIGQAMQIEELRELLIPLTARNVHESIQMDQDWH
jgi:hypothetical protein